MLDVDDIGSALGLLASSSDNVKTFIDILEGSFNMPNIKMKTMGGKVFWNTYVEKDGFKLQQNTIFKNARILDDNDVRLAWGSMKAMELALEKFLKYAEM